MTRDAKMTRDAHILSRLDREVDAACSLIGGRRVAVLSGAGISTESGIPDYRGPDSARKPRTPMQFREFTGSEAARTRYWARSAVGWKRVALARPNAGHFAVARLERAGIVATTITQNVDGLHQAAGSNSVIELHGSLARAVCLSCGAAEPRDALQERIADINPEWRAHADSFAPDGDVDLPESVVASFRMPVCTLCGGALKPDVVFFGESVPKARVEAAFDGVARAELLLVVGSSLTVYSGFRFVDRARRDGKPVIIINRGPTRGDSVADLKIDAALGEALPALTARILDRG